MYSATLQRTQRLNALQQCVAVCCNILHCVAVYCGEKDRPIHFDDIKGLARFIAVLQCVAV